MDRITDACKNITLATTSLRPVTRMHSSEMHTTRSLLYKGSLSGWGSLSGGVSVWGSLSGGSFSGGLCLEGLCPGRALGQRPLRRTWN